MTSALADADDDGEDGGEEGDAPVLEVSTGINCEDGLVVPLWPVGDGLAPGDRFGRGLLYATLMLYLFIGVAIVSDKFMESIEMITAQEKEMSITNPKTGKTQVVIVKVWNETVANLTLMALGSSAPEIMLSVIEIWAKDFKAGDLGPGTIVGSAAFNLFMIIGLRVFLVTATWSVFAYIWLYIILGAISYGEVNTWEGILTFLFFPATVGTAYIAEKRMFCYKWFSKPEEAGVISIASGKPDLESRADEKFKDFDEDMDPALAEFERNRREYINAMKRIRLENPDISLVELEAKARDEVVSKGPKSRAYYRAQATRKMAGKEDAKKSFARQLQAEAEAEKAAASKEEADLAATLEKKDDGVCRLMFDPPHYTVMESVGTFEVTIVREGGNLNQAVQVDYKTEDGTASSEGDYVEAVGTLTFGPGETKKTVTLEVMDDDVFEEDEHFYIRISNLRRKDGIPFNQIDAENEDGTFTKQNSIQLGTAHVATIMILDDGHGGIFGFAENETEIVESVGTFEVKIQRISGARGKVAIPFTTEDGTAKDGEHYEAQEGEVLFQNEETEKIISLAIMDEESYEKNLIMYVNIGEPRHIAEGKAGEGIDYSILDAKNPKDLTEEEKIALLGRPCLGANTKIQIRIKESKEFKGAVDKMMQKANNSMLVGSSSWLDQFSEAFTVQAEDDDEEEEGEEGEEKMPSCGDYIMHFLTLPWKLIFAFIPPTAIYNGYPTFVISIVFIGLCTAVIGDVAGHLGCFIYLKDGVNAIAFVALGTSVPDTFASKTAAIEDDSADNSVGNVTGSNAVNVFLGIGIAWSMAAIYWEAQGENFIVPVGSLGFSVTIFCIEALCAILILLIRRSPNVSGGELGGPKFFKTISSSIFVFFWFFYVAISAMEMYGAITPGF